MKRIELQSLHGIAVVCFIAALNFSHLDAFLQLEPRDARLAAIIHYLRENTLLFDIARVALAVGIYQALFRTLLSIYLNPTVWNLVNYRESLGGQWIYIFKDEGLRINIYGMFLVIHQPTGISVTGGRCWYSGDRVITEATQRAIWEATDVAVGTQIWMPYHLIMLNCLPDRAEGNYDGVISLKIEDGPDIKTRTLCGKLRDHNASLPHGGVFIAKRLLRPDVRRLSRLENIPALIQAYFHIDVSAGGSAPAFPHLSRNQKTASGSQPWTFPTR